MNKLEQIIAKTAGKFFTVTFTKKDGSERVLNGRINVSKHLKGGDRKVSEDYLVVYDIKNGGYRSVNKNTIKSVKFKGEVYR